MLSTIPYTALLSPTPIFSSSSIAVLMFWPWPPMHVDAHTTLYTLHSIPYTALLGPIPIFSNSSIAFLMFWPSPLMHVKDRPYLTLHSLHSSPPTFTLQTPVLNLTPIFSSYSSSSIAFLLFWPPQCTSMDGPGGNRTPPSPNCHLVHRPQNRPRWPPQMVGELPQIGHSRHDCPPDPLFSLRSQWIWCNSLTAGFRNYWTGHDGPMTPTSLWRKAPQKKCFGRNDCGTLSSHACHELKAHIPAYSMLPLLKRNLQLEPNGCNMIKLESFLLSRAHHSTTDFSF